MKPALLVRRQFANYVYHGKFAGGISRAGLTEPGAANNKECEMRKTSMIIAAIGLLAASAGPAMADQMPPGMNDLPAAQKQAKPKPKPRHPARHQQRAGRGAGAHKMAPQPSPSQTAPAMPMKSGGRC